MNEPLSPLAAALLGVLLGATFGFIGGWAYGKHVARKVFIKLLDTEWFQASLMRRWLGNPALASSLKRGNDVRIN